MPTYYFAAVGAWPPQKNRLLRAFLNFFFEVVMAAIEVHAAFGFGCIEGTERPEVPYYCVFILDSFQPRTSAHLQMSNFIPAWLARVCWGTRSG